MKTLKFVSIATNNPLKIKLKPIAYDEFDISKNNSLHQQASPLAIKEYRRRNPFGKGIKYS